jgi:hypothetical protein
MNKYRVWLTDIAMQAVMVEADREQDARKKIRAMVETYDIEFEEPMENSLWEVTSDELTN